MIYALASALSNPRMPSRQRRWQISPSVPDLVQLIYVSMGRETSPAQLVLTAISRRVATATPPRHPAQMTCSQYPVGGSPYPVSGLQASSSAPHFSTWPTGGYSGVEQEKPLAISPEFSVLPDVRRPGDGPECRSCTLCSCDAGARRYASDGGDVAAVEPGCWSVDEMRSGWLPR